MERERELFFSQQMKELFGALEDGANMEREVRASGRMGRQLVKGKKRGERTGTGREGRGEELRW